MSYRASLDKLPEVDVELVMEGSYPYVTGGVSAWTHRLIKGLPEIRFGIAHLAASPDDTEEMKYEMPDNVLYVHNIFLHDPVFLEGKKSLRDCGIQTNKFFNKMFQLHISARERATSVFKEVIKKLSSECALPQLRDFFYNKKTFSLLLALYQKGFQNSSFVDFFWTWRYMHIPLFQIMQAKKGPAKLVHAASTGYAGFYGTVRKLDEELPLFLTEHGIYTRERAIEIIKSESIYNENAGNHKVNREYGVFKRLWLSFFEVLGLWTYNMSDEIITLFEGNRKSQAELGADYDQVRIIPNGIEIDQFLGLRPPEPPDPEAIQVGFVGRVVAIKDIKTLLRAFKLLTLSSPGSFLHIIGPTGEEPAYFEAMKALSNNLGIGSKLKFYGRRNVKEFYPKLDVCVLTSISEGQPLILLEAMAAGIPVVASDVGSCKELIHGRTEEDKALGACGVLTEIKTPAETARGIIDLCRSSENYLKAVGAGIERIKNYYKQQEVIDKYRKLYLDFVAEEKEVKS